MLQPFLTMVVFSMFFGSLAKCPPTAFPYPIFTFAALLPWGLFAKAADDAGRSLVANSNMITKIYFPRLIIPLSSVLGGAGGFCRSRSWCLLGMMVFYWRATHLDPGRCRFSCCWRWSPPWGWACGFQP